MSQNILPPVPELSDKVKMPIELLKRYARPIVIGVCVGATVAGATFIALDAMKSEEEEDSSEEVTTESE